MVSGEKLSVFLKLQQIILDTEDSSNLFSNLLLQTLHLLPSAEINCEFIGYILIDTNNHLQPSHCFSISLQPGNTVTFTNVLKIEKLFDKNDIFEKEILWGKMVVFSQVDQLVQPTYSGSKSIKSLIVSPLQVAQKNKGFLIIGNTGQADKVSQNDLEFIKMVTELVGLGFRLQDTQLSLTNITQEVYKMNAELHQLDKLKDDFVGVASHELRTPMTAIRSYAWMALHRPDIPLSEKMKKYLERTLVSTERLINLVNDMLNVSRIESGRVEVKPAVFDIGVLVDDVVAEVGPKASEKMIHLQVKKDMVSKVFADADKVHQVLLNLIGNSLKFTPNEGIIETSFFTDGQVVEVAVKDNGVGISKEDLSRLFKKFGRLDNSYVAAATSGGTGLGLYIAKSLVELMGGKIWVSSEGVGKGTTFTFSLPIATPATLAQAQKFTRTVEGEAKVLEPVTI